MELFQKKDPFWSAPAKRSDDGALSYVGLPLRQDFIIIKNLQFIYFKAIDAFNLRRPCRSLEPTSRTPGILISNRNQAMSDRILMYVVQSGEIRFLIREPCLPKIMPNHAARRVV